MTLRLKPASARRILRTRPFFVGLSEPSPWTGYLRYFERNQSAPVPTLHDLRDLRISWSAELGRSLGIFRLGETGEGRIAHEIESADYFPVDPVYSSALKLFVAEEGKHAAILGNMLRELRQRPVEQNWTYRLFFVARRAIGLRVKLMVLLAAEIIGCECYGLLARALPSNSAGAALADIQKEEKVHLGFHCHFFYLLGRNILSKTLWRVMYETIANAACISVLIDHRRTFRKMGVGYGKVIERFLRRITQGRQLLRNGCPHPAIAEAIL